MKACISQILTLDSYCVPGARHGAANEADMTPALLELMVQRP